MITELLKMIEEVDPLDTAKLDEIDFLTHYFIEKIPIIKNLKFKKMQNRIALFTWGGDSEVSHYNDDIPEYTRSRDTLKAIRPDGWEFKFDSDCGNNICDLWRGINYGCDQIIFSSEFLLTEELAELHAILQAINYERGQS